MRFDLTQTIAAPVDAVATAYASAELYQALPATPMLGPPSVLDRAEAAGIVTLRVRYQFVGELSPAVTAVIDPDRLTWVEESRHDLAARTVQVALHPDHYADRMRCQGTYRYRADGSATVRQIDGDLKVKALLVASTVERAIISGLKEHLAAEAIYVQDYLA